MIILKNLINRIFRKKQIVIIYKDEYLKAIKRTKKLKLKLPNIDICDNVLLDEKFKKNIASVLNKHTYNTSDINLQCYRFNHGIKKILDTELSYNFMYTIGYIEFNGEVLFQSTEKEFETMIQNEEPDYHNGDGMKLHVWLTLPSMEIIDFTLPTTLRNKFPEIPIGSAIMRHSNDNNDLKYIPLLVGDDFFKKIKVFT